MKKFNPKIVLSMGLGRLHFVQAIEALTTSGLSITAIQGWVPRAIFNDWILDQIGYIIKKPNLSKSLSKRHMPFLENGHMVSLALPEFLIQTIRFVGSNFRASGRIQTIAWRLFGRFSRKHVAGADIFHVRSGAGGGGCINAARAQGAKVLVDHSIAHIDFLSDTFSELPADNYDRIWMNRDNPFWRQVMEDCENADQVVVNSDFVKETFIKAGFPDKKIAVVYLGVRTDFASLKIEYDANSVSKLLFTGTFGWRKGADFLLDALCTLDANGVNFIFRAVGSVDGDFMADKRVKKLGRKIEFTGHVPQDELKSHMQWADLYVFPSLAEGCASSGMEALAAGLPVISTVESGLPITHFETGYLIPRKDSSAIHDAILVLLSDKSLREKLGMAGAELLRTNFTWSDYADNMSSVYERLLEIKANCA